MEYLTELLKEKKQISLFSNFFPHVARLLDEEIARVSYDLCADTSKLSKPRGELVQLHEKVYLPKNEHPDYNIVGHILGPRGMTTKQLEQESIRIKPVTWKNPNLYKTSMCDYWQSNRKCKYGARCWFAHGEHELRYLAMEDLFATPSTNSLF